MKFMLPSIILFASNNITDSLVFNQSYCHQATSFTFISVSTAYTSIKVNEEFIHTYNIASTLAGTRQKRCKMELH